MSNFSLGQEIAAEIALEELRKEVFPQKSYLVGEYIEKHVLPDFKDDFLKEMNRWAEDDLEGFWETKLLDSMYEQVKKDAN